MQIDVGDFEVILRELVLILPAHRPVSESGAPFDVEDRSLPRQEHRQTLDAVRQLSRDRREINSAGLLEVRELRDLHSVEQDLPTDAPRAERRRFPVVFLEADVMTREIESDCAQRIEIDLLHVDRHRLEYHLKLIMLAESEGIVAVAAVGGTSGRLHIRDVPRFRAEDAEEGGRV